MGTLGRQGVEKVYLLMEAHIPSSSLHAGKGDYFASTAFPNTIALRFSPSPRFVVKYFDGKGAERTMGVIDTLTAGYRVIVRRWWLLAIPILLDLFLWMGPRLGIAGVVRDLAVSLNSPAQFGQELAGALQQTQYLLDQVARANLWILLAWGIPGIPSLIAAVAPGGLTAPIAAGVIQVGSALQAVGLALGLMAAGTLLASVYVAGVGRAVLQEFEPAAPRKPFDRLVLSTWGQLLLFLLIIVLITLMFSVPFMFLGGLLALVNPSMGMGALNLFSLLMLALGVWMAVYLFFAVDSIVINGVHILRAMWNSANVVLRNFWPALGLIVLIQVISVGMSLIWRQLTSSPWGTAFAILANAFISTGLVAASFIFYLERFKRWQAQEQAALLAWRQWREGRSSEEHHDDKDQGVGS
ncbi:MAG: hypothetical protein ACUVT1_12555 [Anaerolineae bacterium]